MTFVYGVGTFFVQVLLFLVPGEGLFNIPAFTYVATLTCILSTVLVMGSQTFRVAYVPQADPLCCISCAYSQSRYIPNASADILGRATDASNYATQPPII